MGLRAVDNRESWQAPEQSPAGEAFQCQAGSPTLTLLQRGVVVVRKAAPLCQACGLRPVAWLSLDVLTWALKWHLEKVSVCPQAVVG